MKRIIVLFLTLSVCTALQAQIQFDKTTHDYGDATINDGPLQCVFTFTNTGKEEATVLRVISSCGCTDVKWTRNTLATGQKGTVTATYSNEEGPGTFDKTLTVYIKDVKKPVILHIRGSIHEKAMSVPEYYPIHFGPLGVKKVDIRGGNMPQGDNVSGSFQVANVSSSPISFSFKDVSEDLSIIPDKSKLNPSETTTVRFSIKSNESKWGKNWYFATPLINGKIHNWTGKSEAENKKIPGGESLRTDIIPELKSGGNRIGIWAVTRENAAKGVKGEISFDQSTFDFGKIKSGETIKASYKYSGSPEVKIKKIDCESNLAKISVSDNTLHCSIDSSSLPKGEQLFIITVFTDSATKPIIVLFVSGFVR